MSLYYVLNRREETALLDNQEQGCPTIVIHYQGHFTIIIILMLRLPHIVILKQYGVVLA